MWSSRRFWPEINEWLALEGYRGLSIQAFSGPSFQPEIAPLVWHQGQWQNANTSLRSHARRERDNSSHHYGHDIQLKRHANLPLVGRPPPWQLEHGLKVTPEAQFEQPKRWSRGALCMGPRRAQWMEEQHHLPSRSVLGSPTPCHCFRPSTSISGDKNWARLSWWCLPIAGARCTARTISLQPSKASKRYGKTRVTTQ